MRRFLSISVLLQTVTVLMTLSLAAVCAIYAAGALRNQEEARRVPQILEISNDLYATLQNVRTERGNAFTLVEAASPITPVDRTDLDRLRKASDKALNAALRGLASVDFDGQDGAIGEIRAARAAFDGIRREIDTALKNRVPAVVEFVFCKRDAPENIESIFLTTMMYSSSETPRTSGPTRAFKVKLN